MYIILKSIIITALLTTISCGKKHETVRNIPLKEKVDFQKYLNSTSLTEDTPIGLGALLFINEDSTKMSTCTVFLIDENIALTNSHCIPGGVAKNWSNCKDYVGGIFKTESGDVMAMCEELIYMSDTSAKDFNSPDYAVIKLNMKVTNEVFSISREGVKENDFLEIHTMNLFKNPYKDFALIAEYRKQDCYAYKDNRFEFYKNELSPIIPLFSENMTGSSCNVIGGNSGSPITNSNNDVSMIVFATKKRDAVQPESIQDIDYWALATSLACQELYIDQFDRYIPTDCKSVATTRANLLLNIAK